jgi:gas vesicle protein
MSNSGTRNDAGSGASNTGNQGQRPNPGNGNPGNTFASAKDAVTDKARDVTNRVSEFAGQAKDKAKEVTDQVGDKVSELAGQAKDKAQEWASEAGDAMSYAKDRAQEWATEAAEKTGATVKDLGNELTDLIRRYPAPALLIGFGLGFMIAKASTSSRH